MTPQIIENNVESAGRTKPSCAPIVPSKYLLLRYSEDLERALINNHLPCLFLSWLQVYDPQYFYYTPRKNMLKMASDIIELLAGIVNYFSGKEKLFVAIIKYANTFVSLFGVRQPDLLHLLLISSIVSIKMWNEEKMNVNKIIADLFHLPLDAVNKMEREFLRALNYNLYVSDEGLAQFCVFAVKSAVSLNNSLATADAIASITAAAAAAAATSSPALTSSSSSSGNIHHRKRRLDVSALEDCETCGRLPKRVAV